MLFLILANPESGKTTSEEKPLYIYVCYPGAICYTSLPRIMSSAIEMDELCEQATQSKKAAPKPQPIRGLLAREALELPVDFSFIAPTSMG